MPSSPVLLRVMQSSLSILLINWVFQGMRGMQSKELTFRLVLEFFIGLFFFYLLFDYPVDLWAKLFLSLLSAHTVNWLFNTHLWVCVRYFRIYRRNPEALSAFIKIVKKQINGIYWIDEAVCIGSVGDKGDVMTWRADIDLRLFFKPGVLNYFKLNFYLIFLRVYALVAVIPLDLYAYNDIRYLDNFKKDEGISLIKDTNANVSRMYSRKVNKTMTDMGE